MGQSAIVVVEDDFAVNEGVVMILEKSGYVVSSFLTADDFDDLMSVSAEVYLIDRHLNTTDGLEICRRLKSTAATQHVPVIIMSASPNARQYTELAGGDAFLEKPFSKKQLLAAVGQFLTPAPRLI